MRRIVLCADDYGQAPNISRGILDLVKQGRVSAVSCLVNSEHWQEHAAWLKNYQGEIDIGLHFNLSEGYALSSEYRKRYGARFKPVMQVLAKAHLQQFDQATIEAECSQQLTWFMDALGFLPNHIDGHQHVHQFPLIRDAILNVYRRHLRQNQSYIRLVKTKLTYQDIFLSFKKIIIHVSGTQAFKRLLIKYSIPHNPSFAGIYNFSKMKIPYRKFFQSFLHQMEDGGMIMCHPGLANGTDDIAHARYREYSYFVSEQFLQDCHAANIELTRFVK